MRIKPIKTKKDYQLALARLEHIFDAMPGTSEGDELEVLGILIDNYERNHFPIDLPDPIEAIKFRMEQMSFTQNDLAKVIVSVASFDFLAPKIDTYTNDISQKMAFLTYI